MLRKIMILLANVDLNWARRQRNHGIDRNAAAVVQARPLRIADRETANIVLRYMAANPIFSHRRAERDLVM